MAHNETPTTKGPTMFDRLKNLDPWTVSLIKTCALHASVAIGTVILAKKLESRNN